MDYDHCYECEEKNEKIQNLEKIIFSIFSELHRADKLNSYVDSAAKKTDVDIVEYYLMFNKHRAEEKEKVKQYIKDYSADKKHLLYSVLKEELL